MSTTPTTDTSTGPWSRAGRWLDRAEFWFIALACAGIVVLVFAGVLSRFVFSQPMAWSEELARYLFLWAALVGAAAGCRNNQHGGIPLLVHKFPPGGQRFVEVLVTVLVITVLPRVGLADEPGPFHAPPGELVCAFREFDVDVLRSVELDGEATLVARRR